MLGLCIFKASKLSRRLLVDNKIEASPTSDDHLNVHVEDSSMGTGRFTYYKFGLIFG